MKISQCLAISSVESQNFIYSVTVSLLGHSTTRFQPSSQSTISGSHERSADGLDPSAVEVLCIKAVDFICATTPSGKIVFVL